MPLNKNLRPSARGRVLVVEDHLETRVTLEAVLGTDFDVVTVGAYEDAIAVFRSGPFDVVVTDYDLGGRISGTKLLEDVGREYPSTSGILLTGHTDYVDVRAVQRGGKFLVIFKPA